MTRKDLWACVAIGAALGLMLVLASRTDGYRTRYVHTTATAYCTRGTMASGSQTRPRSAAVLPGGLRLGSRIRLVGRPFVGGLRRFVVRDRIGHGSTLDLWTGSCRAAIAWGRRSVTYKLGWEKPRD